MHTSFQLLSPDDSEDKDDSDAAHLVMANDVNPLEVALKGVRRIDLNFPKFSDGRAYSQAFLLRRRLQFNGDIRATGDVLIDQLVQMQRTGFSSAVLRADQDHMAAQRQFAQFAQFYQGDAVKNQARFQSAHDK